MELPTTGPVDPIPSRNPQPRGAIAARTRQNKIRRIRNVGKKVRFNKFATFCELTFGRAALVEHGVVDVAGGKARMALEFCLERQIPCTVVDPRFSKLSEWTARRISRLAMAFDANTITGTEVTVASCDSQTEVPPRHSLSPVEFFSEEDQKDCDRRRKIEFYMRQKGFRFHRCLFNADYCKDNILWDRAALVIGMHPDEATEAIVDEALKAGKPFAVVPCCVFPSLFKERKLADGKTVRSLEQFIRYLSEKHLDIKIAVMDMPGCNTIVYKV